MLHPRSRQEGRRDPRAVLPRGLVLLLLPFAFWAPSLGIAGDEPDAKTGNVEAAPAPVEELAVSDPVPPPVAEQAAFLGPSDVVASPDGKTLYVVNVGARQIAVIDIAGGNVSQSITMSAEPTGLVLSPDGDTLYVTCAAGKGTVTVVDVKSGKRIESIAVGHWPIGPAISPDGETLYVCNRFDNNVAIVGLKTG